MGVTDPIADYLTRVRNAQKAGKEIVSIPASKVKIALTQILQDEGFIKAFKCIRDEKQGKIKIALKYKKDDTGVFSLIQRVSTPSRRVYLGVSKIPLVKNGYGIAILSTSQGIMTCRQARQMGLGGEHLCSVY